MDIRQILKDSISFVYYYKTILGKVIFIPILLIVLLSFIEYESLFHNFMLYIISLIIYTSVAISTHRIILLGPSSIPKHGFYIPSKRDIKFILYTLVIGILMIPTIILVYIPYAGVVVMMIAIFYLLGRLSLVFPAIAIDQNLSISESWKNSKNYQFSMMIIVSIFPFIVSIPEKLLSYIPHTEILVNILGLITTVFVVAALSTAFKYINEK